MITYIIVILTKYQVLSTKYHLVILIRILTGELARAALGFRSLTNAGLGRFFIMTAHLHFTEETFTLHFFLQRAKCLIDVIITNYNFNQGNIPPSGQLKNGGGF